MANEGERGVPSPTKAEGRARKKNGTAFYMDGGVITWLNENGNGSDERRDGRASGFAVVRRDEGTNAMPVVCHQQGQGQTHDKRGLNKK